MALHEDGDTSNLLNQMLRIYLNHILHWKSNKYKFQLFIDLNDFILWGVLIFQKLNNDGGVVDNNLSHAGNMYGKRN